MQIKVQKEVFIGLDQLSMLMPYLEYCLHQDMNWTLHVSHDRAIQNASSSCESLIYSYPALDSVQLFSKVQRAEHSHCAYLNAYAIPLW